MTAPCVIFACESLAQGNGGISRVDRLIARILSEEVAAGSLKVRVVVFLDNTRAVDAASDVEIVCCGGSRLRFAWCLWRAALTDSFFIYDAAYLARAHPRFLGLRRSSMIFMMGIEVWEQCKKPWLMACRRADMLVSISEYTRKRADELHGGFSHAKICWLATESDSDETLSRMDQKGPQVLVVGRMVKNNAYKGHRELIESWPQVLESVPAAKLVFIGRGDLEAELRQLAMELKLYPHVEFRGFVTEAALNEAYAQSMVFAMPSRGEGFGLVYIEAMRHRLPVVASVHDAGAEVVIDGATGALVNMDQPRELADKIVGILTQGSLAREMGEAGYQRWQDNFTYGAFRRRFLAILGQFLHHSDK